MNRLHSQGLKGGINRNKQLPLSWFSSAFPSEQWTRRLQLVVASISPCILYDVAIAALLPPAFYGLHQ